MARCDFQCDSELVHQVWTHLKSDMPRICNFKPKKLGGNRRRNVHNALFFTSVPSPTTSSQSCANKNFEGVRPPTQRNYLREKLPQAKRFELEEKGWVGVGGRKRCLGGETWRSERGECVGGVHLCVHCLCALCGGCGGCELRMWVCACVCGRASEGVWGRGVVCAPSIFSNTTNNFQPFCVTFRDFAYSAHGKSAR